MPLSLVVTEAHPVELSNLRFTSEASLPVLTDVSSRGQGVCCCSEPHLKEETSSLSWSPIPPMCWGEEEKSLLLQWPLLVPPLLVIPIPLCNQLTLMPSSLRADVQVLPFWCAECEFSPGVYPIVSLLDT